MLPFEQHEVINPEDDGGRKNGHPKDDEIEVDGGGAGQSNLEDEKEAKKQNALTFMMTKKLSSAHGLAGVGLKPQISLNVKGKKVKAWKYDKNVLNPRKEPQHNQEKVTAGPKTTDMEGETAMWRRHGGKLRAGDDPVVKGQPSQLQH